MKACVWFPLSDCFPHERISQSALSPNSSLVECQGTLHQMANSQHSVVCYPIEPGHLRPGLASNSIACILMEEPSVLPVPCNLHEMLPVVLS